MNVAEIRNIALQHGVKPGKLSKPDLIRCIQNAEGNNSCYGAIAEEDCGQHGCLWRPDCIKEFKRNT